MIAYTASERFDLFAGIVKFQAIYGDWGLDDLAMICVVLAFAMSAYTLRRHQDLAAEIRTRRAAEAEARHSAQEAAQAQTFLDTIVDNVPTTIFVRALPEARFVLVNREAEKLLGLARGDMLGKTVADIFPVAAVRRIRHQDQIQMLSQEPVLFDEVPIPTTASGTRITIATGVALRDQQGTPRYLFNVVQDITERKRAEAQIEHLAHHDTLTGLLNRAAFSAYLQSTAERAASKGESFAVLCMDLDRCKEINDVFGHAAGDALLREIAARLQAACGEETLARAGGDEFTQRDSGLLYRPARADRAVCADRRTGAGGAQPGASGLKRPQKPSPAAAGLSNSLDQCIAEQRLFDDRHVCRGGTRA